MKEMIKFVGYHLERGCKGAVWSFQFGNIEKWICRCRWLRLGDYIATPYKSDLSDE